MIKPVQNLIDRRQFVPGRQTGAVDYQDGHIQRPRSIQLGARTRAACVLRNNQLGAVVFHQRNIVFNREGPARDHYISVGQRYSFRFIDQSQQIMMLGLSREIVQMHSTHSQKHAPSGTVKRRNSCRDIRHMLPAIALLRAPGRSGQNGKRNIGSVARGDGIGTHICCEGVRCVHNMRDGVIADVFGQPVDSSEPTHANRERLRARIVHAPGIGVDCVHPPFGKAASKGVGLGRAAKKQEFGHA